MPRSSTQEAVTRAGGLVTVPGEMSFAAYQELFADGVVTRAVLSRPGSLLHRPLLFLVLLTFLFGPRIDGASEFTILRRIVLPMSRGVIAVIGLLYAVGYWNATWRSRCRSW
ncbi:hypothetical protein [Nonomuraea montanisoli]|uniref:hypothetical protein n=1 Tax=Nonomuraea montanisoli TaxID=2741721 RepID=UPI001F1F6A79|nr:hypothetical protein [Nonomuraea montanisoli]